MVENKISFWRIHEKSYPGENRKGWLSFSFSFVSKAPEKVLQYNTTLKKNISNLTTSRLKIVTAFKGQALLSFHSFLTLKLICLINKRNNVLLHIQLSLRGSLFSLGTVSTVERMRAVKDLYSYQNCNFSFRKTAWLQAESVCNNSHGFPGDRL